MGRQWYSEGEKGMMNCLLLSSLLQVLLHSYFPINSGNFNFGVKQICTAHLSKCHCVINRMHDLFFVPLEYNFSLCCTDVIALRTDNLQN